jgi:regulator of nucleoside diphosphate kinase
MEAMMAKYHELIVSASDAEVLALMLGERRRQPALEAAATQALAELLLEARLVTHEQLPADRIAMSSNVTYQEEPGGERRSVILVHPIEADAAAGRISVLSPVGLALLGRTPGSVVTVAVPGAKALTVRVLEANRNPNFELHKERHDESERMRN